MNFRKMNRPCRVPEPANFQPNFPAWLTVDLEVLLNNLIHGHKEILDLSSPILQRIWHELSLPLRQIGVNMVAAKDVATLARVPADFTRILLPGASPGSIGGANLGIIPVLDDFASVLALSNQAQSAECRYPFLLRVRTLEACFSTPDLGLKEILARLDTVSMVDLVGLMLEYPCQPADLSQLKLLLSAFSKTPMLIGEQFQAPMNLFSWNILGIGAEVLPTPFQAEFWAYPFTRQGNEILFRCDLGKAQGLPDNFPAKIEGNDARVVETDLYFSILAVSANELELPARCRGCLVGGSLSQPLSPHAWQNLDLKTFLQHAGQLPIYLIKSGEIEELVTSF